MAMKFMLLSGDTKDSGAVAPTPEFMTALGKLMSDLTKKGVLLDTGGLMASSQSARLRLRGGKVSVTDGPYTETKELIGGYAIGQVNSKEEAIELGRQFLQLHADFLGPSYEITSEVRQMFDPSDLPAPKG